MNAIGYINQSEYEPRFWNMARCRSGQDDRFSTVFFGTRADALAYCKGRFYDANGQAV